MSDERAGAFLKRAEAIGSLWGLTTAICVAEAVDYSGDLLGALKGVGRRAWRALQPGAHREVLDDGGSFDGIATAIVALPRALAIAEQSWWRSRGMPPFDRALLRLGDDADAPGWSEKWRAALAEQMPKLIAAFPLTIPAFASTLVDVDFEAAFPLFDASEGTSLSIRAEVVDRLVSWDDLWVKHGIRSIDERAYHPHVATLVDEERNRRFAAIVKSHTFDPRLAVPSRVLLRYGDLTTIATLNALMHRDWERTVRIASLVESLDEIMGDVRRLSSDREGVSLPVDWSRAHVEVLRFAEYSPRNADRYGVFAEFVERFPELLIDYDLAFLAASAHAEDQHARVERAVYRALDLHPSYAWAPAFKTDAYGRLAPLDSLVRDLHDEWVEGKCGGGALASLRGARGRMVVLLVP